MPGKTTVDGVIESPDGFIVKPDDSFSLEHAQISRLLLEVLTSGETENEWPRPKDFATGREILSLGKPEQIRVIHAAMKRFAWLRGQEKVLLADLRQGARDHDNSFVQDTLKLRRLRNTASELVHKLCARKLPLSDDDLALILTGVAAPLDQPNSTTGTSSDIEAVIPGIIPSLLDLLEPRATGGGLMPSQVAQIRSVHAALKPMESWAGFKKTVARLEALLEQKQGGMPDEGDSWAEAIRTDIAAMPSKQRKAWLGLLENAPKGTTSKPTAKWRKQADPLLAALGPETFATQIEHWFSLIGSNATARMQERNASLLRALVWYASLLDRESVCRALANAVEGGLRKLPAGGLYASSIAKACIAALEAMPGSAPVAQLSRLKHRVKSPWGQQEIQKALATVTRRSGMTEDELEEMTAPTFELDRDGKLCRQLSTLRVELTILGTREVELTCYNENGQQLSKETKIPKSDAAEVKALKNLAGDIGKMLAAQRERVERLFRTNRTWKLATWRERYLNHPLVGVIARRLIWEFTTDEKTTTGMSRPHSGRGEEALANAQFVDLDFQPIVVNDTTVVHLWHPVGKNVDEVIAWRDWLESRQIQQPFKQAHREVYLLTDAERNTRVYSNRFAAHILRQHQLKALCDARGWKYEFRGTWDPGDHAGATVDILQSGLRAQWWIGDGGDDYSPAGVALHVSTDQVRFYRTAEEIREDVSEPLPLDQIPPLVFSEIMRDVDLFVGVASVGNDSMWNDGGPDGRFRDYWQGYAFGDLSATAQTRKAILERLVPRLKIADQCSFADKFLIIRGQLRSYKIHLGSGNILMTPNDQYLCIVPKQSVPAGDGNVFLPFEGDHMLSVILSKAFLLAEDDRIKDATIASQLKR